MRTLYSTDKVKNISRRPISPIIPVFSQSAIASEHYNNSEEDEFLLSPNNSEKLAEDQSSSKHNVINSSNMEKEPLLDNNAIYEISNDVKSKKRPRYLIESDSE